MLDIKKGYITSKLEIIIEFMFRCLIHWQSIRYIKSGYFLSPKKLVVQPSVYSLPHVHMRSKGLNGWSQFLMYIPICMQGSSQEN